MIGYDEQMDMNSNLIPVLDKGYVRLIDTMGGDLAVVNSARASYAKEVDEISQADARLIKFLMQHGHFSTLRHSFATFEMKAPLMVARQIWKYVVGSAHTDPMVGWNESCLPGDQMLLTTDGKMSVEEFYNLTQKLGDVPDLYVFDRQGALITRTAKEVWVSDEEADLFTLLTENGQTITATSNHKIPTEESGDLELLVMDVGDMIYTNVDGERVPSRVLDIFKIERTAKVYDIEIEGDYPYYLANNIVVHNSRRYVTADEEFYQIKGDEWRSAPENSKQGSGPPIDTFSGSFFSEAFNNWAEEGHHLYKAALEAGICGEQARVFLPAYPLYVTWRWSCSLQGLVHFLSQRLEDDAQLECQKYAQAVSRLAQPHFPLTFASAELI